MAESRLCKRIINDIDCTLYKTLLIGILDTEHKISTVMLCNQKLIQCRT